MTIDWKAKKRIYKQINKVNTVGWMSLKRIIKKLEKKKLQPLPKSKTRK